MEKLEKELMDKMKSALIEASSFKEGTREHDVCAARVLAFRESLVCSRRFVGRILNEHSGLNLCDVSQQRELLLAFLRWYQPELNHNDTVKNAKYVDAFLKANNCG